VGLQEETTMISNSSQSSAPTAHAGSHREHDSGWGTAIVITGALTVLAAAFFGGTWVLGESRGPASHRPTFTPRQVPQTQMLVDDRKLVEDERWTIYRFHLDQESDVSEELDVQDGNGIVAYVMRSSDYDQFLRSQQSLWGGNFLQYSPLGAQGVRRHVASTSLDAGDYVLVIKEASDANILGSPDTALTHVHLVATWTPAPIALR
jgi:hypothetical protein